MTEEDLKWHRRFLELAKHISIWSKDSTKVGAVIVDSNTKQIIGLGYNGFPRGVEDSPERYTNRDIKLMLVAHAELNAILNANKSVRGCDIYIYPTMMYPGSCPDCSKAVAQSGIKRMFYYKVDEVPERWESLAKFSKIILEESGVEYYSISPEVGKD